MSALVSRGRHGVARYVHGITSVPLVRNAYSLVGATLVTSGVGVVFWVVAARSYSAADVGIDAALISAVSFLSRIAQLNLANGFNRFVPTAGTRTRRLVVAGYGATLVLSVVAAVVFVAGIGLWSPKLGLLQDDHWRAAWFVVATMLWTIFVLQDSILTGLGEAPWVLVENAVYGVLKLLALAGVAILLPRTGVFFAWTGPLLLLVVPVNALLFGRLIPRRRDRPAAEIAARPVVRFVSIDLAATTMVTALSGILPLLVLAVLGAQANAYFYVAWSIAYTIHLLGENVGMALVTEAARDQERLVEYARAALAHALRIVVPLAVVVAAGAPIGLRAFGADYAAGATRVLQLLALAAIPMTVVVTYASAARVRRRTGMVVLVTGVQTAMVLTLSIVLLHTVGLNGVGWAWLITGTVLAAAILLGDLRTLWLPSVPPQAFRRARERGRAVAHARTARAGAATAEAALEAAGLAAQWTREGRNVGSGDVYTVSLRSRVDDREAMLKLGVTTAGVATVAQRTRALRAVRAAAPASCAVVLPEILAADPARGWLVESRCAGIDARDAGASTDRAAALVEGVVARMRCLYASTARTETLSDARIATLVDGPLQAVHARAATPLREPEDARSLARARSELDGQLRGRTLTTAVVHGNLWLGNVLWTPAEGAVTGIVDWEQVDRGLPSVDIALLLCSTRASTEGRELGEVVADVLARGAWPEPDAALLAVLPDAGELSVPATVLLAWLQHVASHRAGTSEVWVAHNVHRVLERV